MSNDLGTNELTTSLNELGVCVRNVDGNFRSLYDIMCEVKIKVSRSFNFHIKRIGYDALDAMLYASHRKLSSDELFKNDSDILFVNTTGNELDEFLEEFQIVGGE